MTTQHQGQLAEHIVAAHFCELGYNVSFAPSGCRYDLIAEIAGKVYRVQVKSTAKTYKGNYIFWVQKNRKYQKGEFDMIALVALDIKVVAFLHPKYIENKKSFALRPPEAIKARGRHRNFTIADCGLEKALREIKK